MAGLCLTAGVANAVPFTVKVNFQSNSQGDQSIPAGYLPDYGLAYGDRGNGFSYGWSRDISADARDRNSGNSRGDQRYDTLIHFQKGTAAVWEIAIPNGTYNLFIMCGDPDNTDQTNSLNVEGVILSDPNGR
jgi:secreted PhoX family phosphatase